jgi:hypothetical protein
LNAFNVVIGSMQSLPPKSALPDVASSFRGFLGFSDRYNSFLATQLQHRKSCFVRAEGAGYSMEHAVWDDEPTWPTAIRRMVASVLARGSKSKF